MGSKKKENLKYLPYFFSFILYLRFKINTFSMQQNLKLLGVFYASVFCELVYTKVLKLDSVA